MDYERAKALLTVRGQAHLLEYFDGLDKNSQKLLLEDIEKLNFSVLDNIGKVSAAKSRDIRPIPAVTLSDIEKRRAEYVEKGIELIKNKKVAAVLLAGGQGTRLGFEKPKGMFDMGETRFVPIFGLLTESAKKVAKEVGSYFPLFIMTSDKNNADTVGFFKENGFFGYPESEIYFFVQDAEPACDFNGKIFLEAKHKILKTPNGNGGWYSSLKSSGLNRVIEKEGIEWLNVFGVDNVLQKICDPAFIGATVISGCACSSKVVKKACAEEKVGVLCEEDGKPAIVEYYEMPAELKNLRGKDGELAFRYGVTLNYLFNVGALNGAALDGLPYHLAEKAIPHLENGVTVKPEKPNGYKFETLVVDMVRLMGSCLAYETEREKEFAPVKNKQGADSVETARALLKRNGIAL